MMSGNHAFAVVFDDKAQRWLKDHSTGDTLVIAYSDTRCCGGGHIRDLRLRRSQQREEGSARLVEIGKVMRWRILLDRRILSRMPRTIPVTVGGLGPFRGLQLDFSGEEWARLLYDPPVTSPVAAEG